jgi:hypothetical protein
MAVMVLVGGMNLPASGQQIRGRVQDAAAQPIRGAVVATVDSAGRTLDRALTDRLGEFIMPTRPTARRIQLRAIGFRPAEREITAAMRGGRASVPIVLDRLVLELAPVVARAVGCPSGGRDRATAAALWEQARFAFLASIVGRDVPGVKSHVLSLLSAQRENTILSQEVKAVTPPSARAQRSMPDARELAAFGFALPSSDGPMFVAPDADILLDESFRDTHCFQMARPDRGRPGQIGIEIAPAPGRERLVDISGTLWLTQTPLAVRELAFTFEGIEARWRRVDPGGRIVFRTADNGVVVVERWEVRLPTSADLREGNRARVSGGELVSMSWPDGVTIQRELGTIQGRATERGTGLPVQGLAVHIPHTPWRAVTDSTGAFSFANVPRGPYQVAAIDSVWAEVGLGRERVGHVEVDSADAKGRAPPVRLDFAIAPLLEEAINRCSAIMQGPGVVAGRVVDAQGKGVATTMRLSGGLIDPSSPTATARSNADGYFALCGVTPGVLNLTMRDGADRVARAELRIAPGALTKAIVVFDPR